MNRRHALAIALLLAAAALAGALALSKTVALGQSAPALTDAQLQARAARLEQAEADLRRAATDRPPPLPAATPAASPSPLVRAPAAAWDEDHEEDGWDDHGDDDYDDHDDDDRGGDDD